MVLQLFRSPGAFMHRKVGQSNIRLEAIVVLLIGALGALGNAYVGLALLAEVGRETLRFPVGGLILTPVMGAVVLWLGYSIGLHIISDKLFGSRAPVSRLLKVVPWALIPVGIGNLLRSGVWYFVFRDMEYGEVLDDVGAGTAFIGEINAVVTEGASEPLFLLGPVVVVLSILASGYLLVHAVQNAKDLSRDDAVKAVGVLAAIHALYILNNLRGLVL